jgi:NAD(P)-dependent dehydrogenase (short-subunit alcohol dehydrogenase family)
MSDIDLRDKVALVTGAASGLGRATAYALAEAGSVVVAADVDERGGKEVANDLGGRFVRTDVADLDQNKAAVGFAVEKCGGLDLAFLNAGVNSECNPVDEDFDVNKYRRIMSINLDGVIYGTNAVLPALRARGGGSIVATASLAGLLSIPLDPIYATTKHAVVGFARSMGELLEQESIYFNAICPAFAESRIIDPIRDSLADSGFPIIPAEHVAESVLRLMTSGVAGEA